MNADPMSEFASVGRAAAAYALLAAVLVVIVGLPVVAAWRGTTANAVGLTNGDLFAGQAVLGAFLLAWYLLQQRASWRTFFALPSGNWLRRIERGVRIGLTGWFVTLAAMAVLAALTRGRLRPREGFTDVVVWLATRPFVVRLLLVMSAMVIEEAFFRAFLQPRVGIVAATTCFAISHLNYGSPAMSGGVFIIGLILALAFARHRDLAVCAVAHGTFDGIQLLVILPAIASQL